MSWSACNLFSPKQLQAKIKEEKEHEGGMLRKMSNYLYNRNLFMGQDKKLFLVEFSGNERQRKANELRGRWANCTGKTRNFTYYGRFHTTCMETRCGVNI